jgi:hypothetical protein
LKIFNLKYNIDKISPQPMPIYKVCRESFDRSYWHFRQNIDIERD